MPSYSETEKVQAAEIINSYYVRGDAPGLVAYLEDAYSRIQGDPNETAVAAAWTDFIQDVVYNPSTEKDDFFSDFQRVFAQRDADLVKEVGQKADDIRQMIQNDEINGLELISPDPKLVDNIAKTFAVAKTDLGKKILTQQAINAPVKLALSSVNRDISHIQKAYKEVYTENMTNDPRFDNDTLMRYHELNQELDTKFLIPSTRNGNLSNKYCTINVNDDDGFGFEDTSTSMKTVKNLNSEQLQNHINKLETERNLIEGYDTALKGFSAKAKELGKELENATAPEDRQKEAYKDLKQALSRCSNFNVTTKEDFINDRMGKVFALLEKYPGEKFRVKALNDLTAEKQLVDDSLKKGAENVLKEIPSRADAEVKTFDKEIARAKAEMDHRTLLCADPETSMELIDLKNKTEECTQQEDRIALFKDDVKRTLLYTAHTTKRFGQDVAARNIPDKDRIKHRDYFAMTDSAKALSDMDLDKLTPNQILEKMQSAKDAADHYVQTHAGFSNITKGWSSDARQRINDARNISAALDKQIKALKGSSLSVTKDVGAKTLEQKLKELAQQKQNLRSQASAKRLEVLAPPEVKLKNRLKKYQAEYNEHKMNREAGKQGTSLESASYVAQKSIRQLSKVSELNELDSEQQALAMKYIGRVVAYDTKMFDNQKDMSEKQYRAYVGEVNNADFANAVKQTIGDLNKENILKFCSDPKMSIQIRNNYAKIYEQNQNQKQDELNNNQPKAEVRKQNENPEHQGPAANL